MPARRRCCQWRIERVVMSDATHLSATHSSRRWPSALDSPSLPSSESRKAAAFIQR